VLDGIEQVVDAYRSPSRLVPYLSRWVDLDWLTMPGVDSTAGPERGIPTARQRDLIANAAELSARRGTPAGVERFLQLATGIDGFEIRNVPGGFHLQVVVPAAAADQADLVRRIVHGIKPAHLTDELVIVEEAAPIPELPSEPEAPAATEEPGTPDAALTPEGG